MARHALIVWNKTQTSYQICELKPGMNFQDIKKRWEEKGYKVESCNPIPSIRTLTKWLMDGIAKATDGCKVEPDETCPHGRKSWLLEMNIL